MVTEINSLNDVKSFAKSILEEGVNIHPDDDFASIVNIKTKRQTYTSDEAKERNAVMERCFDFCEENNFDLYDVMQEVHLKETGLDKFIPLPK
jgi:hypothetical protein